MSLSFRGTETTDAVVFHARTVSSVSPWLSHIFETYWIVSFFIEDVLAMAANILVFFSPEHYCI